MSIHQAIEDATERQWAINLGIVEEAAKGNRGDDQKRIADEVIRWGSVLLRKNADYGSSAWKRPALAPDCDATTAIRVRMSDKLQRIQTLLTKDPEVVGESLHDSIQDLGAYCLLLLTCPDEEPTQ